MNRTKTEELAPAVKLLDEAGLYQTLSVFLGQHLKETPPDLFEEVAEKGNRHNVRAKYEVRYTAPLRFPHISVVNRCTEAQFLAVLALHLEAVRTPIQDEQPACQWALVGAMVRTDNQRRVGAVATSLEAPAFAEVGNMLPQLARAEANPNAMHAFNASGGTRRVIEVPEYVAVAELVWADLSMNPHLTDPNERLGGNKGPMSNYAQDRFLRLLPWGLSEQRKEAKRVIAQMKEALAAEERRDEVGVATPSSMRLIDGLTQDQIRDLRRGGMTWHALADAFRCTIPELKERAKLTREETLADAQLDAGS